MTLNSCRSLQKPVPAHLNLHGLKPLPLFLGQAIQIAFGRISAPVAISVIQEGPSPLEPAHLLNRHDGGVQGMGADPFRLG